MTMMFVHNVIVNKTLVFLLAVKACAHIQNI